MPNEMPPNDETVKKVIYHRKLITKITKQALHYIDETGATRLIDFKICRKNWVKYVNQSDEFARKEISEAETVCIGRRNLTARPPFIEFFTEPRTRFEFPQTFFDTILLKNTARQNFRVVQTAILGAGWSTLDLS